MNYFLITDLQGTCSDYGLAMYLRSLQRGLGIIQFVVPVILIIMAAINLVQLMLSPDDPQKKRWKSLTNKFVAAIIVFFIPLLVNIFFSFMPETVDIANCWKVAKEKADEMDTQKEINKSTKTESQTIYPTSHESENKEKLFNEKNIALKKNVMLMDSSDPEAAATSTSSDTGDSKREKVVKYALSFVGKPYKSGGYWNGELPYTATDCSGFVVGVYKHFGYDLTAKRFSLYTLPNKVKPINTETLKKGDILYYSRCGYGVQGCGHVSIYIGNGKVVSASGTTTGVKVNEKYDYRKPLEAVRVID